MREHFKNQEEKLKGYYRMMDRSTAATRQGKVQRGDGSVAESGMKEQRGRKGHGQRGGSGRQGNESHRGGGGGGGGRQGGPRRTRSGAAKDEGAGDMRQLTQALVNAREGNGEVAEVLMKATFRPRLPGLTKMVSRLSKDGMWKKALEFFEAASNLGFEPDTALVNAAISACDKGCKWQKALQIFDQMDLLDIPRDAITYSATISALAKGKQWNGALQVFQHMQASGVDADVVTCCSLINALERGGQWAMAEKLFLEMCTVQHDSGQQEGQGVQRRNSNPANLQSLYYNSPTSVLKTVMRHSSGIPAPLASVHEHSDVDDLGSLGIICSPIDDTEVHSDVQSRDESTDPMESLSLAFRKQTSIDDQSEHGQSASGSRPHSRRDSASSAETGGVDRSPRNPEANQLSDQVRNDGIIYWLDTI